MAKTLLELLNSVGKKLRRSKGNTYTTIDQDMNAVFMVEMINEAKRMVEQERHWNILREQVLFTSVAGTSGYDTSDLAVVTGPNVTRRRSRLVEDRFGRPQFWDTTDSEFRLHRETREVIDDRNIISTNESIRISQFSIYPNRDGLQVQFRFTPSTPRDYRFDVTTAQDTLEDAATELLIYEDPVIFGAVALAAEERGEELGLVAATWWERYNDALAEAIVLDSDPTDYQLIAD